MSKQELHFVDAKTFKNMVEAKESVENVAIRKQFFCKEIVSVGENDSENKLKFRITTPDIDRENDRISLEGWDFSDYQKNPVVLWAHDYRQPPVAKALSIIKEQYGIDSDAEFTSKDLYEFGYMIYQMYKQKFMNAVSVGFQPSEWQIANDREGGINFTKQALLEYSAVPVPANPHAIVQARSFGIDTIPLKSWAESVLDNWEKSGEGLLIPKATIEEVWKDSDPKGATTVPAGQDPGSTEGGNEGIGTEKGSKPTGQENNKAVISYGSAHANGTSRAPKDAEWNGPEQVSMAEVDDLKIMCTWFDSENPELKGSYKLPHHNAGDNHICVWRGVTAAMGALLGARGGVNIPDDERRGVYNHLSKHYDEFEETPPEFRFVEAQVLRHMGDDYHFDFETGKLWKMTDELRLDLEISKAKALIKNIPELGTLKNEKVLAALGEAEAAFSKALENGNDTGEVLIELIESKGEPTGNDEKSLDLPEGFTIDDIKSAVSNAVVDQMNKATGRLD